LIEATSRSAANVLAAQSPLKSVILEMEWCNLHSVILWSGDLAGKRRIMRVTPDVGLKADVHSYRNRTTGESQNNTQLGDVYAYCRAGVSPRRHNDSKQHQGRA
jgi:hypothetical protein